MTKFKDVAHLYIDCELKVNASRFIANEGSKSSQRRLNGAILSPSILADIYEKTFHWDDFKPILRPLSSMTDEEAYEIGVNHNWYVSGTSEKYMRDRAYSIRERIIAGTGFTPTLMLHLLNLRFDLFGLIESGEAIDSTTV